MNFDYQTPTIELLRQVVEAMQYSILVEAVQGNSDGTQTLTCCDIYYAEPGRIVTINSNQYTIVDIDPKLKTITVSAGAAIAENTSFPLYPVYFFHGTPKDTNVETNQIPDAATKYPMIWVSEIFNEQTYTLLDARDRSADVNIFFITQANPELWLTKDYYHNAIGPMRRLYVHFMDELTKQPGTFYTIEMKDSTTAYPQFGEYIKWRGIDKNLFADRASGILLQTPIVINKDFVCLDC